MRLPFEGHYRTTDGYEAHKKRGSKAPGVDYALPLKTPVCAARDGKIIRVEWGKDGGRFIIIQHKESMITLYSHLELVARVVGEWVKEGDVIAYSGATGNATGPCLHFGVCQNGVWSDPLKYISL